VVVGGFYFTLLSTAGSVVGIRTIVSPDIDTGIVEDVDLEDVDQEDEVLQAPSSPPAKPFSDALSTGLCILTGTTGLISLLLSNLKHGFSGSSSALFMLSATLHNFVYGSRLPKTFTKVVHPLVTCTMITWATQQLFAMATGSTFFSVLKSYKTGSLGLATAGAGDILLFLLGPAVVSLAISMYDRRRLMRENLLEVFTAIGVSSFGGLFGTAAIVRLLRVASPYLRLSLLSRNITSPLAMAIANILGGDVSLAVSMVVVTGLIGANFGGRILDAFGVKDAVARGLGIGAAAHGLGTAAIVNEKDAFPFAAIAMALTATTCTCLVSVPAIKSALVKLALGV
jgi:putative effector of murein hydrolase